MENESSAIEGRGLPASQLPADARRAWADTPPRPQPHQVWRARWQSTATLVVILKADMDAVTAAAATTTPDLADNNAIVVTAQRSHLGVPLVVWDSMARQLPVRVLDRCLGSLDHAWSAGRRPHPVLNAADRRNEERAVVQDRLDDLENATWVRPFRHSLTQLLEQDDNAKLLLKLPGLSREAALSIRRGRRALTDEQAAQMSVLSSIPAEEWLAAGPALPDSLVDAIDQPSERPRITRLAHERGLDEITARQEIAYDVYALAARQTGDAAEDWGARLHHYLQANETTSS